MQTCQSKNSLYLGFFAYVTKMLDRGNNTTAGHPMAKTDSSSGRLSSDGYAKNRSSSR